MAPDRTTLLAPDFSVHRRAEVGGEFVTVKGDLDVFTTRALRAQLEECIWRCNGDVVIDLTAAGSIDTHALAALLNAARRLARRDRSFTVVCSGPARRAFDITGVGRQLTLLDDPSAVLAPA